MGHDIILLYSGGEGSRSKGAVPGQMCCNFPTFSELAPSGELEVVRIKDSSVYLALLGPAGGRGCARAEHRTEESLIQPAPPVPALPGPFEWPYSLIRPK